MGQKVNPISLRLQQTNREFDNCWYTDYFYRKLVSRDIYLQQYINSFLKLVKCPSARFSIQYSTKNIKLYSFLCYPKQSRELRSRMFGITLKKKRKNNLKKRNQLVRYSRRKKTLKFLLDNRLWSRVYNPFNHNLKSGFFSNSKKEQAIYTQKDTTQLNTISLKNMYNVVVLPIYANDKLTTYKNYIKKPGYFLLPSISKDIFHKTKPQLVSVTFPFPFPFPIAVPIALQLELQLEKEKEKEKEPKLPSKVDNQRLEYLQYKKQNYYLLSFIKNFIATLVFVKTQNTRNSFISNKKQKAKKLSQHSINKNFSNFNTQYKKNFLKFFLVFHLLYTEYNRNTLFSDFQLQSNRNHHDLFVDLLHIDKFLQKKKYLNIQNLLNQINCFSNFQPISLFHATLQNKTPINYLLQQNSSPFYKVKRDEKLNTIDFLQGKKLNFPLFLLNENKAKPCFLENKRESNLLQFFPFLNTVTKTNTTKQQQLKYKNYIQGFLSSQCNINVEFLPFSVSQDWQSAGFLAEEIVYFLERRVTFRRLKNKIIKKISENSNIRGIRISCSGRVGGKSKKAQRAKTECVKYGQTSRHTFSSPIDFAAKTARTSFGTVGIKVWICYN